MLLLLINLINCEKPVFFAPGIGNSELYATILKPENFPHCKGTYNHTKLVYIDASNITECKNSLLDTVYHKETGKFTHPDGVIIETDGIVKDNSALFLQSFNNSYYVYYDWVLYYLGIQETFSILQKTIEQKVTESKEKAVLVGFSLGTSFMRYFSTKYSSREWLQKYVDGIIFLSPGLAGTFSSIGFVATENAFSLTGIAARHMISQWVMFPNFPLFENCIEIDGKFYNASDAFDLMEKANYTDDTCKAIYNEVKPFLEEKMPDPGVRTAFIYNSGLPAKCGVKVVNGESQFIYCGSDGGLEAKGAQYACSHWNNVYCHDYQKNDQEFSHFGIINQPYTAELVRRFVAGQPFPTPEKKGKLSTKIIIIVVVAVVAVLIIALLFYCIVKNARKRSETVNETLIAE